MYRKHFIGQIRCELLFAAGVDGLHNGNCELWIVIAPQVTSCAFLFASLVFKKRFNWLNKWHRVHKSRCGRISERGARTREYGRAYKQLAKWNNNPVMDNWLNGYCWCDTHNYLHMYVHSLIHRIHIPFLCRYCNSLTLHFHNASD